MNNVSAEFRTESKILRWRPDNVRDWNLGTISKHGLIWLDLMSGRANSEGLLELPKQFLQRLVDLVPRGVHQEDTKRDPWYVANDGKRYITADTLLANETRRNGWIRAIADFQSAVAKTSQDDWFLER
jgi:hypothetical protein